MLEGEVVVNYHSSSCGFFIKNADGGVVKIGPVEISSFAPNSSPTGGSGNAEGELWFNSSTKALKIFHEGEWITVAKPVPIGFTGEVTVGDKLFTIVDGIIADVE
jgi:hypothetical protein